MAGIFVPKIPLRGATVAAAYDGVESSGEKTKSLQAWTRRHPGPGIYGLFPAKISLGNRRLSLIPGFGPAPVFPALQQVGSGGSFCSCHGVKAVLPSCVRHDSKVVRVSSVCAVRVFFRLRLAFKPPGGWLSVYGVRVVCRLRRAFTVLRTAAGAGSLRVCGVPIVCHGEGAARRCAGVGFSLLAGSRCLVEGASPRVCADRVFFLVSSRRVGVKALRAGGSSRQLFVLANRQRTARGAGTERVPSRQLHGPRDGNGTGAAPAANREP